LPRYQRSKIVRCFGGFIVVLFREGKMNRKAKNGVNFPGTGATWLPIFSLKGQTSGLGLG